MSDPHTSKIPGSAVGPDNTDLVVPTVGLLRGLSLLPEKHESVGPMAAITGTPDSVAVIEAGATALSKGWAAGLGASVLALWAGVRAWWPAQNPDLQVAVIWGAAIATAALVAGLAYIVGSDVRGRAAASVATINARAGVAQSLMREAAALSRKEWPVAGQVVPISPPQRTDHWLAKESVQEWVSSADVERR